MNEKKKLDKADQSEMHAVLLQKDHKHQGEKHLAGSTIHVSTTDKNWLLAQHVIAPDTNAE